MVHKTRGEQRDYASKSEQRRVEHQRKPTPYRRDKGEVDRYIEDLNTDYKGEPNGTT